MGTKTKVLAICQREIPSALVGVNKLLNYLKEKDVLEFQFVESIHVKKSHIAETDVLVCIRGSEQLELNIVKECKRLGKYIIYFLDDDLLSVPDNANSSGYFNNEFIRSTIIQIMRESNCLWSTNKNISRKYEDIFAKTVVLDAPALLLEHYKQNNKKEEHDTITIGFAGGLDHKFFLEELLEKPIQSIINRYNGKVKFEFFGAKPAFVDKFGLQYIPYESDHNSYRSTMLSRNWDIGLAPLPSSSFHGCKYFNKFLEYGAIEAAGVYSNVEPFNHIVENERNGILVQNTCEEWAHAIGSLIDNKTLRKTITDNAKSQLEKDFNIDTISEKLTEQIPEICGYSAPAVSERQVELEDAPKSFILYKIANVIRREGFNAPAFIIKKVFTWIEHRF
ncbi:hypothetical protein [Anaerosolibacter sp.]|uniref:hypothetical protein n=1 Tax=Anaerosolibacter sp. TaxID=1872527 RepID=UPI0039F0DEC2